MTPRRSASLSALFPPGVAVFVLDEHEPVPELAPIEAEAVRRAVPSRWAEFARGRACARAGLRALGLDPVPIPMTPSRAPDWPASVVGSITHCAGLIAAAVAPADQFAGIGLDAEPCGALEDGLATRIASADELECAAEDGLVPRVELPRLVFSAKEVVHKCIHPGTGEMLDFLDVAIAFDHAERRFRVEPRSARARALPALGRLTGRYWIDADHLVTAGVVEHA